MLPTGEFHLHTSVMQMLIVEYRLARIDHFIPRSLTHERALVYSRLTPRYIDLLHRRTRRVTCSRAPCAWARRRNRRGPCPGTSLRKIMHISGCSVILKQFFSSLNLPEMRTQSAQLGLASSVSNSFLPTNLGMRSFILWGGLSRMPWGT